MSEIPPDISLPNARAAPEDDSRSTLLMRMSEVGLPKEMPYLSHPLFREIASWLTLMVLSSMHKFEHESGTMPSVSGASNEVLIVTLWTFTLLQYTGCMLQAGEFKNVKFEMTISSEYRNSRRLGRLWFSSWERNHCHHTKPWPSITPLFPVMTTSVKLYPLIKL